MKLLGGICVGCGSVLLAREGLLSCLMVPLCFLNHQIHSLHTPSCSPFPPLPLCSYLLPVTTYPHSLCSDPQPNSLMSSLFPGPHRCRAYSLNSPSFSAQLLPALIQLTWVSCSTQVPKLCSSWVGQTSCEVILVHVIYFLMTSFPHSMGRVSPAPHMSPHQTQDSVRVRGSRKRERAKT